MSAEEAYDHFAREKADAAVLNLRPGLVVFVGRRQRLGATDVMAGTKKDGYFRAVHCVGGDHHIRAAAVVANYRAKQREG